MGIQYCIAILYTSSVNQLSHSSKWLFHTFLFSQISTRAFSLLSARNFASDFKGKSCSEIRTVSSSHYQFCQLTHSICSKSPLVKMKAVSLFLTKKTLLLVHWIPSYLSFSSTLRQVSSNVAQLGPTLDP